MRSGGIGIERSEAGRCSIAIGMYFRGESSEIAVIRYIAGQSPFGMRISMLTEQGTKFCIHMIGGYWDFCAAIEGLRYRGEASDRHESVGKIAGAHQ